MIRKLTPEAKEELRKILWGNPYIPDAVEAVEKWYENLASFSEKITPNPEEENLDDPHFSGKTYEKGEDQKRLNKQMFSVFDAMIDEQWYTQQEVADKSGQCITSLRARFSDLRQPRWGRQTLLAERVKGGNGLWRYKLIPNKESMTYAKYIEQKNRTRDNQ